MQMQKHYKQFSMQLLWSKPREKNLHFLLLRLRLQIKARSPENCSFKLLHWKYNLYLCPKISKKNNEHLTNWPYQTFSFICFDVSAIKLKLHHESDEEYIKCTQPFDNCLDVGAQAEVMRRGRLCEVAMIIERDYLLYLLYLLAPILSSRSQYSIPTRPWRVVVFQFRVG